MGFHGEDKNLVRTFFVGHRKAICQMITDYTNSCNELPSIDRFIRMLAEYIRLLPSDKFADIKRVMTLDNMNDDTELIQANFNKVAKGIKIPQQPPPPPAPTPASSSSEPEFDRAYLADDGMGDSKGKMIDEQGMTASDAAAAVNQSNIKGEIICQRTGERYLHKTVQTNGGLGVQNLDKGKRKVVTFLYKRGVRGLYCVGVATHISSEGSNDSFYRVIRTFIRGLRERDTLSTSWPKR